MATKQVIVKRSNNCVMFERPVATYPITLLTLGQVSVSAIAKIALTCSAGG